MRNFLVNIFMRADRSRFKSIAIPAIGTGNLGVPHAVVTAVMYDEVQKFSQAKPATTLKDIRFVVYDKDLPTLKVERIFLSFSENCDFQCFSEVKASVPWHEISCVSE